MSGRLGARELIDVVVDSGSWTSWDGEPVRPAAGIDEAYRADLAAARAKSGEDESILTGEGRVHGRRVAVIVSEFRFLAGSIGVAAAERLVAAFERATIEGLPILAGPASGGTRMQEGALAFLSMVKISAAAAAHREAGLPLLVYLRHPTTGGVFASWASQGHVTVAEPDSLIGFLGPRVYEALYGAPFPEGVQTGENLRKRGLVDAVLPPERIGATVNRVLDVLMGAHELPALPPAPAVEEVPDTDAWESITLSRKPSRPGVRDLLRHAARDVLPLFGTGQGESDPGLLLALARFGDAPCIVLGQDRHRQAARQPLGPAALREARRGMRISRELGLPLVTVIDTPGAALSREAEEGGLAGEISRSISDLVTMPSPTVSLIIGEGSGGGALALIPADVVLSAEHGWLSPLPPEGASAIVHRTTERAPEMARAQQVRALDLQAGGVVDHIIPEHPDAAEEPEAFCRRVGTRLEYEIIALMRRPKAARYHGRLERYRTLGL